MPVQYPACSDPHKQNQKEGPTKVVPLVGLHASAPLLCEALSGEGVFPLGRRIGRVGSAHLAQISNGLQQGVEEIKIHLTCARVNT